MIPAMASKKIWAVVLAATLSPWVAGACATGGGTGDDDDDDGTGGSTGPTSYAYRRPINIEGVVPEGYSLPVTLHHTELVLADKSLATGDDVRVFFNDGTGEVELDRVLEPASAWNLATTTFWFRTQEGEGTYYVYYGQPEAVDPPVNGQQVFDVFDDFEDGELDAPWLVWDIGTGSDGSLVESDGALRVSGAGQDIGAMADNCVLGHRTIIGNFAVEAEMREAGGSLGGPSKIGGLMVRETSAEGSKHGTITRQNIPAARYTAVRNTSGADTTTNQLPGDEAYPLYYGIERFDTLVGFTYTLDGSMWIKMGADEPLSELAEAVQVGVPIANASSGAGWVDVEWFRVRKLVRPSPVAGLGAEEEL